MSIKSKIQALITAANAKTGESDTTLTDAVQTLVDGYGQGSDGNYAKKTGTFVLESNYTYSNSAAGAYTGSILIDTGLLRIDALIVWSEEWEDDTEAANCFGLSLGFNNDIPVNNEYVASPYQQYSGMSFMRNGATRKYYGSALQGIIFHNATNGVPEGKFGLRCHSTAFPIIAGHTIHWAAWGVGDQDDLPIVDGIVVKERDTNGYTTKIDVYGDVLYRTVYQPIAYANAYDPYYLTEINLKSLPTRINKSAFVFGGGQTIPVTIIGLENVTYLGMNAFYSDNGQGGTGIKPVYLEGLDFSKITSINSYCFYQTRLSGAVRLRSDCTAPEQWCAGAFRGTDIESIYSEASFRWNGSNFYNCKNLVSAEFTKGVTFNGGNDFYGCTALETVVLGSVGNAPSLTYSNMFSGCTQSGLTITLFAKGANVDSYLRIIRTGATNATIIIKASEATEYNATSYAAGDTILTSMP